MNSEIVPNDLLSEEVPNAPNPFLNAAEGYYVGALIDSLHQNGVLQIMKKPCTIGTICAEVNLEPDVLGPVLGFLASKGDWLKYDATDCTFQTHSAYFKTPIAAHILDQYIGAYGPCLTALQPKLGADLVNRDRHAASFAAASGAPKDLVQFILGLTPACVLDLGCGTAGLLKELVALDPDIQGVGIDANPAMVGLIQQDPHAALLTIHCGDVLDTLENLPSDTKDNIELVIAQSLANEFFGERTMDEFLSRLSRALPNRLLIVADYYGCLNNWAPVFSSDQRRAVLHDVAQVVSGQGIPPGKVEDWREIYERNGCVLIKASSIVSGGIHRFIHVVKV